VVSVRLLWGGCGVDNTEAVESAAGNLQRSVIVARVFGGRCRFCKTMMFPNSREGMRSNELSLCSCLFVCFLFA